MKRRRKKSKPLANLIQTRADMLPPVGETEKG
jgi:hypothetical protein